MAFKTFYFALWLCLILFTVVKGSCLEYGHSCWGAHGKRSGNNNKIYHMDIKSPSEVDFQDLNGLSEKNNYDSTEEQTNASSDSLASNHDLTKDIDELIETPDKTSFKLKKFLYKKLNKNNVQQRNIEHTEHMAEKSINMPMISERWRRLPLYNLRRLQINKADNDWLRQLETEPQTNDEDYI